MKQGDVNEPNSRGQSALYCASRQGCSDIVLELLMVPGIDVNISVPEHGGTPLHGWTSCLLLLKPKLVDSLVMVNQLLCSLLRVLMCTRLTTEALQVTKN